MDEDQEVRDSDRSDTEGSINSDAESDLDSDRISPSEESDDSSEELTEASLAPYSFEPSDSDSASASPDDDDDARDERLSDFGNRNILTPSLYVLLQPAATQRFTIVRYARSFTFYARSTVVYLHAVYRERVPLVTSRSSPASNRMYYPVLVLFGLAQVCRNNLFCTSDIIYACKNIKQLQKKKKLTSVIL